MSIKIVKIDRLVYKARQNIRICK